MWPTNPAEIRMLFMTGDETGTTKQKDLPKVLINPEVSKKWKGELKAETYALLLKYQAFHHKSVNYKPSESELVNKGLLVTFESDEAFQKFLGNGGGKPAVSSEQVPS
jgi:hypothetical protein